jgi:hypothetical protein
METNNTSLLKDLSKDLSETLTNQFVDQLTPLQQRAFMIAKEHLKTSFDLDRSNGFVEWKSKNTK